jgi:serine/threonine protein kinase
MPKKKKGILSPGDCVKDTYYVKFFLGEGAFGEVYQVEHSFLNLQVMKVFKDKYAENSDLDTLMNEARILVKLTHENLVRVYEANHFSKGGNKHYYLTLDHVSGETLAKRLEREIKLDAGLAVSIQLDILEALSYVHNRPSPIVHRDVNLDNILLAYKNDGIVGKLSDFGLAQSIGQVDKITDAAGRFLYFAPECFWGSYLPASDVFSAGIVLYRMLTGIFPWSYNLSGLQGYSKNLEEQIRISRNNAPRKPSVYSFSISSELDRIVLKSLELSIEDRYSSTEEFLNDLNDINPGQSE